MDQTIQHCCLSAEVIAFVWGKALAELEIRLMVVGLLKQVQLSLAVDQDLDLQLIPSPSPKDGLKVVARHYAPDDARE